MNTKMVGGTGHYLNSAAESAGGVLELMRKCPPELLDASLATSDGQAGNALSPRIDRVIVDFAAWRVELMRTGRIPPDSDTTVDRDQAGLDCQRYVELVDMVRGDEGREVFDALLASMQVPEDYEVYESTVRVLHHFKTPDVGERLYDAWDGLAQRSPEMAGTS